MKIRLAHTDKIFAEFNDHWNSHDFVVYLCWQNSVQFFRKPLWRFFRDEVDVSSISYLGPHFSQCDSTPNFRRNNQFFKQQRHVSQKDLLKSQASTRQAIVAGAAFATSLALYSTNKCQAEAWRNLWQSLMLQSQVIEYQVLEVVILAHTPYCGLHYELRRTRVSFWGQIPLSTVHSLSDSTLTLVGSSNLMLRD